MSQNTFREGVASGLQGIGQFVQRVTSRSSSPVSSSAVPQSQPPATQASNPQFDFSMADQSQALHSEGFLDQQLQGSSTEASSVSFQPTSSNIADVSNNGYIQQQPVFVPVASQPSQQQQWIQPTPDGYVTSMPQPVSLQQSRYNPTGIYLHGGGLFPTRQDQSSGVYVRPSQQQSASSMQQPLQSNISGVALGDSSDIPLEFQTYMRKVESVYHYCRSRGMNISYSEVPALLAAYQGSQYNGSNGVPHNSSNGNGNGMTDVSANGVPIVPSTAHASAFNGFYNISKKFNGNSDLPVHVWLRDTEANLKAYFRNWDFHRAPLWELEQVLGPLLTESAAMVFSAPSVTNYATFKRTLFNRYGMDRQALKTKLEVLDVKGQDINAFIIVLQDLYLANTYLERPLPDEDFMLSISKGLGSMPGIASQFQAEVVRRQRSAADGAIEWSFYEQIDFVRKLGDLVRASQRDLLPTANTSSNGANGSSYSNMQSSSNTVNNRGKGTQAQSGQSHNSYNGNQRNSSQPSAPPLTANMSVDELQAALTARLEATNNRNMFTDYEAPNPTSQHSVRDRQMMIGVVHDISKEDMDEPLITDQVLVTRDTERLVEGDALHTLFVENIALMGKTVPGDELVNFLDDVDGILVEDRLNAALSEYDFAKGDAALGAELRKQWEARKAKGPVTKPKTIRDVVERIRVSYPISNLITLDDNLRKYLLYKLLTFCKEKGHSLVVPESLHVTQMDNDKFAQMYRDLEDATKDMYYSSTGRKRTARESDMDVEQSGTGAQTFVRSHDQPLIVETQMHSRSEGHAVSEVNTGSAVQSMEHLVDKRAMFDSSTKHYCCEIGLGPYQIISFVDEGASGSMITKSAVEALGIPYEKGYFGSFRNADNSKCDYIGRVQGARIQLHNELVVVLRELMVADVGNFNQMLLGNDVLQGRQAKAASLQYMFKWENTEQNRWELLVRSTANDVVYPICFYQKQEQRAITQDRNLQSTQLNVVPTKSMRTRPHCPIAAVDKQLQVYEKQIKSGTPEQRKKATVDAVKTIERANFYQEKVRTDLIKFFSELFRDFRDERTS